MSSILVGTCKTCKTCNEVIVVISAVHSKPVTTYIVLVYLVRYTISFPTKKMILRCVTINGSLVLLSLAALSENLL